MCLAAEGRPLEDDRLTALLEDVRGKLTLRIVLHLTTNIR